MTFATRSIPREADDPPPDRRQVLEWERQSLLAQVRPRIRSARQELIRRRITELTTEILKLTRGKP